MNSKIIFLLLFFSAVFVYSGDKNTIEKKSVAKAICNTLQCLGEDNLTRASTRCRKGIEHRAKYQYEWSVGSYDHIFTQWKSFNESEDLILYIGDKIKMQNGFGVYVNQVYTCTYSIKNKKALFIDIGRGKL